MHLPRRATRDDHRRNAGQYRRRRLSGPDGTQPGDQLVAVAPFEKQAATRQNHDGWAYQTNTTSLNFATDDAISGYLVTKSGPQEFKLNQPLVLFNLVVSLEWDAQPDYLDQLGARSGTRRTTSVT